MSLQDRVNAAIAVHRSGDLAAALTAYETILADHPEQPDALHYLGLLRFQRGDAEQAIALIKHSLALQPGNSAAHNNLGNVLVALGRDQEALRAYGSAIHANPEHADAWSNLGVMMRKAELMDEAVEMLSQAVTLAPGHTKAWHNLGLTYLMMGKLEEAANAFEACLDQGSERWPDPVWHARVLCALGRNDRAIQHLEQYIAERPDDPVARYQLQAMRGEKVERATDDYVRAHFDSFAESYDEVLRRIQHRGPELVAAEVDRLLAGREPFADVVDLGCGTGLVGPLIRKHARKLTGVDLSREMLRRAAALKTYDYLVEGELVAFLKEVLPTRFDLATCVDTLCYFGPLKEFMTALAAVLKPGGIMVATVESLAEGETEAGFRLDTSGRYAHSESHLRTSAEAAGLTFLSATPAVLRRELGKDVEGFVFVVRLPAQ